MNIEILEITESYRCAACRKKHQTMREASFCCLITSKQDDCECKACLALNIRSNAKPPPDRDPRADERVNCTRCNRVIPARFRINRGRCVGNILCR